MTSSIMTARRRAPVAAPLLLLLGLAMLLGAASAVETLQLTVSGQLATQGARTSNKGVVSLAGVVADRSKTLSGNAPGFCMQVSVRPLTYSCTYQVGGFCMEMSH